MYSAKIIAVSAFLLTNGLAQQSADHALQTIFPVPFFGFDSNIDDVQASAVSFSGDVGVLTLSCGSSHRNKKDCYLQPTPTLTLGESIYRLNLGIVATQDCAQTSTATEDTGLTVVCTQSTSGVDQSSQIVTYSGNKIHYGTVTLTGGLDKFSSALNSLSSSEQTVMTPRTSTGSAAATTTSGGSVSSSGGAAVTSSGSTTTGSSSTSSATTSASSSPTPGAGNSLSANSGFTLIGAIFGAFAWVLL